MYLVMTTMLYNVSNPHDNPSDCYNINTAFAQILILCIDSSVQVSSQGESTASDVLIDQQGLQLFHPRWRNRRNQYLADSIATARKITSIDSVCQIARVRWDQPHTYKTNQQRTSSLVSYTVLNFSAVLANHNQSVICFEVIKANHLVRALSCRHIYHKRCFDQWFVEFCKEYCPLCLCLVSAI